jgi:DNA-binding transcriptional regulator LsrR (DeoR family)
VRTYVQHKCSASSSNGAPGDAVVWKGWCVKSPEAADGSSVTPTDAPLDVPAGASGVPAADGVPGNGGRRFSSDLMHAAATLYYLKDETQADVARTLGVSRATVSRLLAEARRLGIVRIDVLDPTEAPPASLARDLAEALGISAVRIAPLGHDAVLNMALATQVGVALSAAGLERDDVLLVSSGRTVWQVGLETLPQFPGTIVTPMVGGQHEPEAWYQTNEITRMIAQKVGGHPTFLYAPAQPGPELYDLLLQDPGTKRVLELWSRAKCALVGVGAPPQTRASMPNFVPRDADWLGASAGDICTRFFDGDGRQLSYPGSERLIATTYETLRQIPHTIAVAVGQNKVPSVLAGARAAWFNTLVTDTPTASALLERARTGS